MLKINNKALDNFVSPADKSNSTAINYKNVDYKDLRGHPADPEGALMFVVYDQRTKKPRRQLLKRKKVIDKKAVYLGIDGQKHLGVIIAFCAETGKPMLYCKDNVPPKEDDCQLLVILE